MQKVTGKNELFLNRACKMLLYSVKKMHFFFCYFLFFSVFGHIFAQNNHSAESFRQQGIEFGRKGDYDKAKEYFLKSIKFANDSDLLIARNYSNLGIVSVIQGENSNATYYCEKVDEALEGISESKEKRVVLEKNLFNYGNLFFEIENFEKAILYYQQALDYVNSYNLGLRSEVYCLVGLGNVYSKLLEEEKAIYHYRLAEDAYDGTYRIALYQNLATSYLTLNKLDLAEKYLFKSLNHYKKYHRAENPRIAFIYNNLGRVYFLKGNFEKAEGYLDLAESLYLKTLGEKHVKMANVFRNKARMHEQKIEFNSSLIYIQKALYAISEEALNGNLNQNPSKDSLSNKYRFVEFLYNKAQILQSKYQLEKNTEDLKLAFKTIDYAIGILEENRAAFNNFENKSYQNIRNDHLYKLASYIVSQLYDKTGEFIYAEKAFLYAEQNKSSILKDHIADLNFKQRYNLPANIEYAERELNNSIAKLKEQVFEENLRDDVDKDLVQELNNSVFHKTRSLDSLREHIKRDYLVDESFYKFQKPDINKIQRNLKRNQSIVEYTLSDSILFVSVLNKRELIHKRVLVDSAFYHHADSLINIISSNYYCNYSVSGFNKFVCASEYLYKVLIKPVEQDLKEELIIIPDAILNFIPFEVLTKGKQAERAKFGDLHYLFKDYMVSYHFSAGLYSRSTPSLSLSRLIGFAPEYSGTALANDAVLNIRQQQISNLKPLPYAKKEVNDISRFFKSDLFLEDEATEERFKKQGKDYHFIHLAMHSVMEEKNPLYSKLVFSNQATDSLEDNLLNVYELMNMRLNARLAVLSSCNSGYGKFNKGEGVLSLARGFIYAGSESVVTTLWPVEDKSGSILMQYFYKELRKGYSLNKALSRAKMKFLNNADPLTVHPYFWANYVLIGDTDRVFLFGTNHLLWFLMIVVVLGVLFIVKRKCC